MLKTKRLTFPVFPHDFLTKGSVKILRLSETATCLPNGHSLLMNKHKFY